MISLLFIIHRHPRDGGVDQGLPGLRIEEWPVLLSQPLQSSAKALLQQSVYSTVPNWLFKNRNQP